MKINSFVILIALITAPFCLALNKCREKAIIDEETNKIINIQSDINYAYNEVASCASLQTEPDPETGEETLCCYVKLKFKNELLDETFTQKGCCEVETSLLVSDDTEFGDLIDIVETDIENNHGGDSVIDIKSLSIDCSSKYLHLAGLAILFFFL